MNKLISMTDFVLKQIEQFKKDGAPQRIQYLGNYANFLKQTLKLEMFVPCDDDGNILEELNEIGGIVQYPEELKQYQKAQEKVIFEGFTHYQPIIKPNPPIY